MSVTDHPPAVRARGVRRSYGDKLVLDGVDLVVPTGKVFALLGPNGAGKTTLVQILTTLIGLDDGDVEVAGHDVVADAAAVREVIGVTGQFSAVDDLLTARENLELMADLYRLDAEVSRGRVSDLLARFDLVEATDQLASTFSGGMRRRLDLAMTLVGDPRIIFLDEPTTGLDPRSRRDLWRIVRDLVAGGVTVFLTTQYLEEADQLADTVAILDQGRLVAQGTPAELKRRIPDSHVRLTFDEVASLRAAARTFAVAKPDETELALQVPCEGDPRSLRTLLDALERDAIRVTHVTVHPPDLDDVFLALTGQPVATRES